jgi:hypothetical protein
LNYSYAALSDVHGYAAYDHFQTIGPIVLITPAALDPKTRKPSALLGPAEVDAATRTDVTVGAPFADPLLQGSYGMCEAAGSTTATRPATKYCVHIDNSRRRSGFKNGEMQTRTSPSTFAQAASHFHRLGRAVAGYRIW